MCAPTTTSSPFFAANRAFVRMREQLTANAEILRRLAEIDRTLLQHDQELSALWDRLQLLLSPPDDPDAGTPQPEIGFHVREKAARYTVKRTRFQLLLHPLSFILRPFPTMP